MAHRDYVQHLNNLCTRLEYLMEVDLYFNQYPPLTRGETIQHEMTLEEIESVCEQISEVEELLYNGGQN